MELIVADDSQDVGRRAADVVRRVARDKPDAAIGLATGRSPGPLYEQLAAGPADLSRCRFFTIDEWVGVAPDHPASNHRVLREAWLQPAGLDPARLDGFDGAATDMVAECRRYQARIADAGGLDLVILGIGRNGHVAFNEPPSDRASRCRPVHLAPTTREDSTALFGSLGAVPDMGMTIGIADILEARSALLLAWGSGKAEVVAATLRSDPSPMHPASALHDHRSATVVVDRAAAACLRFEGVSP